MRRLQQWRAHLGQRRIGLPLLSAGMKLGIAIAAGDHVALRTSAAAASAASLVQAGLGHLAAPVAADRERLRPHAFDRAGPLREALTQSLTAEELRAPLLGGLMTVVMPLGDAMVITDAFGGFRGHEPAPCVVANVTVFVIIASALLDLLAAHALAHTRALTEVTDAAGAPANEPAPLPPQRQQQQQTRQPAQTVAPAPLPEPAPAQAHAAVGWEVDVQGQATVRVPARSDSPSPLSEKDFLRDASPPASTQPAGRKTIVVTITRPDPARLPPGPLPMPHAAAPGIEPPEEV